MYAAWDYSSIQYTGRFSGAREAKQRGKSVFAV